MERTPVPPIGPSSNAPVTCELYDFRATVIASLVSTLILDRIDGVAVEHVGSTAVSSASGTGTVDLLVLHHVGARAETASYLEQLGFRAEPPDDGDAAERPDMEGGLSYGGREFRVHLRLHEHGAREAAMLVAFRDRLREDPRLLAEYVMRKREIIAAGQVDPRHYARAKRDFFRRVRITPQRLAYATHAVASRGAGRTG